MSTETSGPAQTAKSARTRERILDAAAQVLSRKGYAGTRLADVAEVAGIQAPAIYYYFGSRDDLVEEVMWAGAHRVRAHVEEVLAALPDADAGERLLAAVDAHLRYELLISDYTTASVRNAGQVPEHLRVRPAAEEGAYSRLWRDLFQGAQDAGLLREGLDINVFRLLLLGSMNWAVEWWNPRTRSLDDLVRGAQDMVRFGTFARP
ncbi:TetR/AcrR family transcriptional regulator [Microbacterium telephonicum]|uniref:TetR family transcriptional regulator n=1 Tax=Microbacterium telephonicum TaxID=1714841 RepID=A0A498C1M1_9MICO|nr:TetR/AcrR family transcriptional regulator [Microbacterium telephonicum]RLK46718.1 TetR family transcriptional regulator [Microbacterium telephonicum]